MTEKYTPADSTEPPPQEFPEEEPPPLKKTAPFTKAQKNFLRGTMTLIFCTAWSAVFGAQNFFPMLSGIIFLGVTVHAAIVYLGTFPRLPWKWQVGASLLFVATGFIIYHNSDEHTLLRLNAGLADPAGDVLGHFVPKDYDEKTGALVEPEEEKPQPSNNERKDARRCGSLLYGIVKEEDPDTLGRYAAVYGLNYTAMLRNNSLNQPLFEGAAEGGPYPLQEGDVVCHPPPDYRAAEADDPGVDAAN